MRVAQLAQALEVARQGRNAVHVAGHRLDDDRGDLAALRREAGGDGVEVVVGQGDRQVGDRARHAGRIGHAEGQGPAARLDQEAVGVAVVAALELDDAVAAGRRARHAHRAHRRLGAGVDHADHVEGRHDRAQPLGHLDLGRARRAETQTAGGGSLHGGDDLRMRVAGDGRAPGADVVDVGTALDVVQAGALGALEEYRVAADAVEGAHGGIDAAGDMHPGACDQVLARSHRGLGQWVSRVRRGALLYRFIAAGGRGTLRSVCEPERQP